MHFYSIAPDLFFLHLDVYKTKYHELEMQFSSNAYIARTQTQDYKIAELISIKGEDNFTPRKPFRALRRYKQIF